MLGIDRRAARSVWTAAVVVLLLWLLYIVRSTLFVFTLALLFAYLLSPLVNLLHRSLPGRRTRTLALALAYLLFVAGVVIAGIQVGSRVVEQADSLRKKFPDMIASWEKPASPVPGPFDSLKEQVLGRVRIEAAKRSSDLVSLLPQAGLKFLLVASDLIFVVIIPILSFFFLKDADVIRHHILELVEDGPPRALLDDVLADIHLLLAHYMQALVLLSLAVFITYTIFFKIVGAPYGFLLSTLAALLEFIPMIGPLASGVIILVVSGVSGAPILPVVIFLIAYRVVQDYVISPHLMGQGVELHPLLVLFGVFAGAEVAGIAGTFLSVPVIALVRILYRRIRKARLSAQLSPSGSHKI